MSKWTLNIGLCLMWMIVIETWIVMTQRRDQYLPKPHAKDTICQSFQQNNDSQLNILAIGITRDGYLRLITKNNLSYVMPAYALDPTNNKLYLMTWPQPLDIQLSKFFDYYKPIMKFNSLVWLMFDQDGDWICVATNYSQTEDAFNYDIKHRREITGWYYLEANLIVLSADVNCQFYTIKVSTSLRISRSQCEKSIKELPIVLPKTGHSVICFDESGNNITIVRVKDEPAYCKKPVQWPILTGFVFHGNFYLFGHSYVYVFEENAYMNERKMYPFQQIRSKASSLQNGTAQPPVMADNQAASSTGSSCVDSNMISNTSASRSKRSSKRSPSSRAKST
uniref:Uncharacterized protein LOC113792613 n=1 Tax=Dermatophagoides pteronyssinus TaxID=6956 RepID=A0A6P6XYP6_DERPT|nr:uncharacterized protein LOC113792613 [Dermatophagoides pteronyssinus]